jgi:hypothetical protein
MISASHALWMLGTHLLSLLPKGLDVILPELLLVFVEELKHDFVGFLHLLAELVDGPAVARSACALP